MGVGRNHQFNALSPIPTEKYTAQCCGRHHFDPFSLNKAISKCFVWLSLVVISMQSHMLPDSPKEMMTQAECSCHLVLFFSERSAMGECLGVTCITITLLLHSTPLLILLAVARLNRLNPWTDWYIGACQRRCEELSFLLRCHCHYFMPLPLPSPFPTSYQGDRS